MARYLCTMAFRRILVVNCACSFTPLKILKFHGKDTQLTVFFIPRPNFCASCKCNRCNVTAIGENDICVS